MQQLLTHLPAVIMSGFLGLVMGNFATNPIYRLPLGEKLFVKDPYCDSCKTPLTPRDLFPLFSWLISLGRCRYCGVSIPGAYALTEGLSGILFIVCYLQFGLSEQFLLAGLGMLAFIMIAMMLTLKDFFSHQTLIAAMVTGMLFRTLHDGTIYDFAGHMFAATIAGVLIWQCFRPQPSRDLASFPPYVKLLAAAGVWLSLPEIGAALLSMLIGLPLRKSRPWLWEWIITVVTILSVTHILQ